MSPAVKNIFRYTLLTLLTAYLVGMVFWSRSEASRHKCKGISIAMEEKGLSDTITVRGVTRELKRYGKPIVGSPVNTINTLEIENYLMRLNNFESVECYISTNGYLNVRISPMVPEIRVFEGDKSYYVNKDGKRISANAEFYTNVPIVSGKFTKDFSPKEILPVVRFVENDPELKDLIAMYSAKDADNIILVPRITGHVVNFGDTTRLEEKKRMLLTAYQKIMPYKGWEEYDTISVRFRGQIIATRRNKTPLYPFETVVEEEDPEDATLPEVTPENQNVADNAQANKPAANAGNAGG